MNGIKTSFYSAIFASLLTLASVFVCSNLSAHFNCCFNSIELPDTGWVSLTYCYLLPLNQEQKTAPAVNSAEIAKKVLQLPDGLEQHKVLQSDGYLLMYSNIVPWMISYSEEIALPSGSGSAVFFLLNRRDCVKVTHNYFIAGIIRQGGECYLPLKNQIVREINPVKSSSLPGWIMVNDQRLFTNNEKFKYSCNGDFFVIMKNPVCFSDTGQYQFNSDRILKSNIFRVFKSGDVAPGAPKIAEKEPTNETRHMPVEDEAVNRQDSTGLQLNDKENNNGLIGRQASFKNETNRDTLMIASLIDSSIFNTGSEINIQIFDELGVPACFVTVFVTDGITNQQKQTDAFGKVRFETAVNKIIRIGAVDITGKNRYAFITGKCYSQKSTHILLTIPFSPLSGDEAAQILDNAVSLFFDWNEIAEMLKLFASNMPESKIPVGINNGAGIPGIFSLKPAMKQVHPGFIVDGMLIDPVKKFMDCISPLYGIYYFKSDKNNELHELHE